MFFLKKLIFKFMELGLGLRTCFSLETRNPVFVNFRLSEEEAERVKKNLPAGVSLQKIRFSQKDGEPAYWISYNLYEIKYPKKELSAIRKVRCEINTFVEDALGRKGVYVFCDSPFVSKEEKPSLIGKICDFAERIVTFIYGCGKLIPLKYELSEREIEIDFKTREGGLTLKRALETTLEEDKLSDEYWIYNDISFFNRAKTFDLVNVNSAFFSARFQRFSGEGLEKFHVRSPYFQRKPDCVYFHRGDIAYLVNSMNKQPRSHA